MVWILVIVAVIALWIFVARGLSRARRSNLLEKYGDPEVVDNIVRKVIWQGESEDQLMDSLGRPLDIDEKVLKTKKKQVWKYNQTAKNRYGLKITLENGVVVGWDQK